MIPANIELGMPGANDQAILADIGKSIGRDLALVREALAGFRSGVSPARDVNDWYAKGGDAAKTLGRVILAAYYRDDRVLVALGHEARAPFPMGYVVEQGDWSLLDAVKRRSPLWRDDRGDGRDDGRGEGR